MPGPGLALRGFSVVALLVLALWAWLAPAWAGILCWWLSVALVDTAPYGLSGEALHEGSALRT